MANFPLLTLPPILVENVITKLEWRTYLRQQQTCRLMRDLVKRSKNIHVYFGSTFCPERYQQRFLFNSGLTAKKIESTALFGSKLNILRCYEKDSRLICDWLQTYRITCRHLYIYPDLSTEECASLIKVLKPVMVNINSEGTDRFHALFSSKTVKQAEVDLKLEEVTSVVPKLLSTLDVVNISMGPKELDLIKTLVSGPFSRLRSCKFTALGNHWQIPDKNYLKMELCEFYIEEVETDDGEMYASIDLTEELGDRFRCKLFVNSRRHVKIICEAGSE